MALPLNREDGVIGKVEEPRRFGFPPFEPHPLKPIRRHWQASAPQPRPQARRILFIEDDRLIADMYRMKLEGDGFIVEVAQDGESGARMAMANPPDLILLDVLLPRLDGIEVLRLLRAERSTRHVPVLILSNAVGLGGREEEARSLGIVDWVIKANVTPSGLVTRVSRILSN
ncbi:MAG TPA: response regulator [Candidatus Dormibacteraeota bacterium]|nr:response regulator [Candidatus Dormibacteraeota bacterium]